MNNLNTECVINSLNQLSKLRVLFSPKRLIQNYNFIKFSSDTILIDLSSIFDKNTDKNDLKNALKFVYNGHCCFGEIEDRPTDYTVYFTITKDNLIGGVFHIPTGKKLSIVNIIGKTDSENEIDSQFLYSVNDSFFKKLKEKISHI